jgi:hypothetical protein
MFSWRRLPWPTPATWRVLIATVPVWIAWICYRINSCSSRSQVSNRACISAPV